MADVFSARRPDVIEKFREGNVQFLFIVFMQIRSGFALIQYVQLQAKEGIKKALNTATQSKLQSNALIKKQTKPRKT